MKNQILITLDSLRYDVFAKANLPYLKSFEHSKAYTHGTYTLPAHMAFFTGKLPSSFNGDVFDNLAKVERKVNHKQHWRLLNPESQQPSNFSLEGMNIVDGFNKKGWTTIGTGAVSWFNTNVPAHLPTVDSFQKFEWFGEYIVGPQQINFLNQEIAKADNYFAFMNMGETHHPFRTKQGDPEVRYGNPKCFDAQVHCVEYLEKILKPFIDSLEDVVIFICGDHGDCLGEDGLWGHSFYHEKVMEVPIIKIIK